LKTVEEKAALHNIVKSVQGWLENEHKSGSIPYFCGRNINFSRPDSIGGDGVKLRINMKTINVSKYTDDDLGKAPAQVTGDEREGVMTSSFEICAVSVATKVSLCL
jgi:hypothetical protein